MRRSIWLSILLLASFLSTGTSFGVTVASIQPSKTPTFIKASTAPTVANAKLLASKSMRPEVSKSVATPKPKSVDAKTRASIQQNYGKLPLRFELNEGQINEQVKFRTRGSGYNMYFTPTESVLVLSKKMGSRPQTANSVTLSPSKGGDVSSEGEYQSTAIRMQVVGANPTPKMFGEDLLPGKSNYFKGSDPEKWRTNISNFKKVRYQEVYPGIDLVYYGNQRQLEYDFIVQPGVDPKIIQLAFEGVESYAIENGGDLVLHTALGNVIQKKPVIYQEIDGKRERVAGNYIFEDDQRVAFHLGSYDKTLPLVIDPVLVYSTFLGGDDSDGGFGIAVDASGAAYVTGQTNEGTTTDFPTSPVVAHNGSTDVFVTKLNASGSALVYSTFLGGDSSDRGNGIVVDASGNAYVTGATTDGTTDFPTTPGAFNETHNGADDAFVTKLNADGSALLYSTFLGSSTADSGSGIALDTNGRAYVTGANEDILADFPTTTGAFNESNNGSFDAFVSIIDPSGNGTNDLVYSTLIGGDTVDEGRAIAVDSGGNAFITGRTAGGSTPVFPTTTGAFDDTPNGIFDVFVVKLNPAGGGANDLVYSTFLGGSSTDEGNGIAVDGSGNTYVTGRTFDGTTDFPTTIGAFSTTNNGSNDVFVSKLNPSGGGATDLVYSTLLGGDSNDQGFGIAVDQAGNAYVTGFTLPGATIGFPTTIGAFDTSPEGTDAFVLKLNPVGDGVNDLLYSTLLGDNASASGNGIAVDSNGNIYVTGGTDDGTTTDFPTTTGAFDETHNGADDAFVTKIIPINTTTYWNLINPEGESDIIVQFATYATLADMLNDENRTGLFTPDGGGIGENIVGSGSDGTNYWNLFNFEGESATDALYVFYDTLGDMLNDTNRVQSDTPNAGGEGTDVVGSGSDGTIYWNLFNPELAGGNTATAFFATYDNLNDMLADSNRLAGSPFDTLNGNIVGSGSDGTSFWELINIEIDLNGRASFNTFPTLADLLARTNSTGPNFPDGGGVANNIVGSGATNKLAPVAVAGPDQAVTEGDPVILDGTGSLPDPNFLNFDWQQSAGSPTVILDLTDPSKPTFTAPAVTVQTTFTFDLIVDINGVLSNLDTVDIVVDPVVPPAPTILNIQVDSSSDDAEEQDDGDMILTSSDLELTDDNGFQGVGIKFNGVTVPVGATITKAYVQFTVDETESDPTNLTINGELNPNAPTFTTTNGNISSRTPTGNSVPWSPVPWLAVGEAGPDQQTPDLTAIIQEIIDQGGWASGNSLVIIINGTGERVAESFNGDPSGAARLHIEFTTAPPVLVPVPGVIGKTLLDASTDIQNAGLVVGNITIQFQSATDPGIVNDQDPTGGTQVPIGSAVDLVVQPAIVPNVVGLPLNPDAFDAIVAALLKIGTITEQPSAQPAGEVIEQSIPSGTEVVPLTKLDLVVSSGPAPQKVQVRVSASSDDAEEQAGGSVGTTSSDLEMTQEGTLQTVGIRFQGVNIPPGATITKAFVQFQVDEATTETTELVIKSELTPDAPTFTSDPNNITSRSTGTSVPWNPVPWPNVGEAGPDQRTSDITALIQQTVDQGGWLSGNALAIIISGTGKRVAESFDGDPNGAALLHVEFNTGPPPVPGEIGDTVFDDFDNNGVQDAHEPGIPGVTVAFNCAGGATGSQVTDANGNYLFTNVPAGPLCTVTTSPPPPAGFVPGDNCPTSFDVTLAPGESFLDADFCFIEAPTGSIGDTVFNDIGNDGVQDAGDPGIEGVTVAFNCADGTTANQVTDANGNYLFTGVPSGPSCTVTVPVPPVGLVPGDNCPGTFIVTLASGQSFLNADFCFAEPPTGSIGDQVFNDINDNGIQDNAGEPGLPGVTVDLSCVGGTTDSQVTDANGNYLFTGVPAGPNCSVSVPNSPAGLVPGNNCPALFNVALTPGQSFTSADFCFIELTTGSIGDTVFNDINDNGVQDAGDPGIEGVTVAFNCADGTTANQVTDANGEYLFTGVPAGPSCSFSVPISPAGFVPGTNCPTLFDVTLSPGDSFLDADFCFFDTSPAPTILDVQVNTSSDDAEEQAGGSVGLTSSDLEMTQEGSQQTVGIRFQGVNIPPGATITKAYIQFTVDEATSESTNLIIEGEKKGNPLTFTNANGNITSRTPTAASVPWNPVPWPTVGAQGPDQQTSDITPVVQEIVDQGLWANGNSMVFIITGTGKRVADSFDGDPNGAAVLHVEFSSTPPVLVTVPPVVGLQQAQAEQDILNAGLAVELNFEADVAPVGQVISQNPAGGAQAPIGSAVRITISTGPEQQQTVLDIQVNASSDDAEESSSGGVSLGSSDLELTFDNSNQTVGMRFNNLIIPSGAIITKAYVQFQVDEASSVATDLTIKGELNPNTPTFINSNGDISSRTPTGASVPWSPVPWLAVGEAGPDQQTPDISAIVQEIVDQGLWASGNSLVILITGTGELVAESFNGDPNGAAVLHVEFALPPP